MDPPAIVENQNKKIKQTGFHSEQCLTTQSQGFSRQIQQLQETDIGFFQTGDNFSGLIVVKSLKEQLQQLSIEGKAAIVIQRYFREYIRKRLQKVIENIRKIRNQAAEAIQRLYRQHRRKIQFKINCLVQLLVPVRNQASIFIQKFVKGFLTRKNTPFLNFKYLNTIIFCYLQAQQVEVSGSFTSLSWKEKVPMKYSKTLKVFYSDYIYQKKPQGKKFFCKFYAKNKKKIDYKQPVIRDTSGNQINVLNLKENTFLRPFQRTPQIQNLHPFSSSKTSNLPPFTEQKKTSCNLQFIFRSCMKAHPIQETLEIEEKSADALFYSQSQGIFALADGVGQWENLGLDSSRFSNELIQKCQNFLKANYLFKNKIQGNQLLDIVLYQSFNQVKSYGSSTILIGILNQGLLYTNCLGDSGYIILREKEDKKQLQIVFKTEQQQHSFNKPFQLTHLPQKEEFKKCRAKGLNSLVDISRKIKRIQKINPHIQDSPCDAVQNQVELATGDILIAASDGLFDNIFEWEIILLCEEYAQIWREKHEFAQAVADQLVRWAVERGFDASFKSPFAKKSKKASMSKELHLGGKLDDTTVLVGVVVDNSI